MEDPLNAIINIPLKEYYEPNEISSEMENFTKIYIKILFNQEIIETAFKRAIENEKTAHGLFGVLNDLQDNPIHEKKYLIRTEEEKNKGKHYRYIIILLFIKRKKACQYSKPNCLYFKL